MSNAHPTPARKRFSPLGSWLTALGATIFFAPLLLLPRLLHDSASWQVGLVAPTTIRVSPFAEHGLGAHGSIAVARGDSVDAVQALFAGNLPVLHGGTLLVLLVTLFLGLAAWVFAQQGRARQHRYLLSNLGAVGLVFAAASVIVCFTSASLWALPLALPAGLARLRSHRNSALATALLSTLLAAALVPFDPPVVLSLLAPALVFVLLLPAHASLARVAIASAIASLVGFASYTLFYIAAWRALPTPASFVHSTWLASAVGPLLTGVFLIALRPLYDRACGEVSAMRLAKLERLSQPLLKQIAAQAPGTWQHSLAMATFAERAGAAIGADTRLLRVGAYYHDIGKALEPKYFLENLGGAENSVHENLVAGASRDAIFEHVSEGARVARESGLPRRVIEFIESHHGCGELEYFRHKHESEEGGRSEKGRDFRFPDQYHYPGHRPQCPETAILCICDALEGATRQLKSPSRSEIAELVHHILFGKVRTGQLDEADLSLADLRAIQSALVDALRTAHAPAEARELRNDAISTARQHGAARVAPPSARLAAVRLDSLDLPKRGWTPEENEALPAVESVSENENDTRRKASAELGLAATENLQSEAAALSETEAMHTDDLATPPADDGGDALETLAIGKPNADADNARRHDMATPPAPEVPLLLSKARPASEPFLPDEDELATSSELESEADLRLDEIDARAKASAPASAPAESEFEELFEEVGVDLVESETPAPVRASTSKRAPSSPGRATMMGAPTPIPPAPPPGRKRSTIPLEGEEQGASAAHRELASRRADSEDGLRPGEMVVGAPPGTRPSKRRSQTHHEDATVQRRLPVPDEARRPEDRITEELAFVPPDAYRDEDDDPRAPSESDPS